MVIERGKTMKIAILDGSPRKQNTAAAAGVFAECAQECGHEAEVVKVGTMKIAGCKACEYCHGKGEGACVQKDDMDKVIEAYKDCDVLVLASPIYYFGMTAQIEAAIQRVYCIGKPPKATKAVLLLSSGSPNVNDGAIGQYKSMLAYMGIEDAGIVTAAGDENGTDAKFVEIRAIAKAL